MGEDPCETRSQPQMTRTVWWEEGQVKMIDQRTLPEVFQILACEHLESVAEAIRDMAVRGAPAIGATGAFGMALAAWQSEAADTTSLLESLARAKATLDASNT